MKNLKIPILFIVSLLLLFGCNQGVSNPKGIISQQQLNLFILCFSLMLIVVIPVIIMAIVFPFKYREGKNAQYKPEWGHNNLIEIVCWGVPVLIILVLGTVTYISSHKLDPYRPIDSDNEPITVQVVSLDWKWLFIYPHQNIATVNYLALPNNTPVEFQVTSHSVMNAFWIPQLGGQIYAMSGMKTKLHLMAKEEGTYKGAQGNYSGYGFGDMDFRVDVMNRESYNNWLEEAKSLNNPLTIDVYNGLREQSIDNEKTIYSNAPEDLFSDIIMDVLAPQEPRLFKKYEQKYPEHH